MTERDPLTDTELDDLFASAREAAPRPSADLMGRILADAAAEQAPWWHRIGAAIGGWPALAGLAATTMAGVWIGFVDPDTISTLTSGYLGDTYDFTTFSTELSLILAEG